MLERIGISTTELSSIDEIDAALCAVAADYFVRGQFKSYGDEEGGFIVVPALGRVSGSAEERRSLVTSGAALAQISALMPHLNADDRRRLCHSSDTTRADRRRSDFDQSMKAVETPTERLRLDGRVADVLRSLRDVREEAVKLARMHRGPVIYLKAGKLVRERT